MLALERIGRDARNLPGLVKVGVVGLAFSGLADVVAHLEEPDIAAQVAGHVHQHSSTELSAHLAGLVSMVIVLVGVVIDGARQQRARRRSPERSRKGVA